ncbi:MAG: hypothetical protein COX44_02185 [Candidatus Portnoybacteria bacterium CG23_combo_of_CG06-09_8_20_14_all_37_13]|uniref:DUF4760 domain-containing protein n=1 Tax=Candidatus Portnoybacteria bacterium CG23_combo_of_CG06-09_8_20_14_all_37_13 TaxID=1974819 RepID=A0A2G9YCS9_9BACT|nr:MAG: hypothetical protein COX44_02185 [Candidatus Portnoybacteria bacterium CG23_combo_of_CG06-09_8_20_14_all_37_13]
MNKTNIINVLVSIIILLVIFFSFIIFKPNLTKADFFNLINELITLIVGGFAIYLYLKQKADRKRDASKNILQEIRRAEEILDNYKSHNNYVFSKKIIATDNWAKNIHYFVGDLYNDELDKISALYSMGKYLDSIIQ